MAALHKIGMEMIPYEIILCQPKYQALSLTRLKRKINYDGVVVSPDAISLRICLSEPEGGPSADR